MTNINDPIVEAAEQILAAFQSDPNKANVVFLISDGYANWGETDPIRIDRNFRNSKGNAPVVLHTFSVGNSDNYALLKRLTIFNGGDLHYIKPSNLYEDIRKIYKEVECPLLSNIQFNYPDGSVEDLTLTSFPYFFRGQELIVSGRILQGSADILHMNITGNIRDGRSFTWRRSISMRLANESQNSCLNETMLAYLKVAKKYEEYSIVKVPVYHKIRQFRVIYHILVLYHI